MTIKVTAGFQDNRSGWSESYYFADAFSSELKPKADQFVNARVKVLGLGSKLMFVRIGDPDDRLKKMAFEYDRMGEAQDGSGDAARFRFADQAHSSVLMPYRSAKGVLRYVTTSGIPDAWLERATELQQFRLTGVGETKINEWYLWLRSAPWPLQIHQRIRTGASVPQTVKNITEHATGRYQIEMKDPFVVVEGQKVVLTKIKGNNLYYTQGIRKVVTVISDVLFTIDRGPRGDLGAIRYDEGGKCARVNFEYDTALYTPEPYKVTTRKRGRPFSARRGRRSASP